jgi:hypothetical protein
VAAVLFCSPEKKNLCLNRQNAISAAVTTIGGLAWGVAGAHAKKKTQQPVAAAVVSKGRERRTRSQTRGTLIQAKKVA